MATLNKMTKVTTHLKKCLLFILFITTKLTAHIEQVNYEFIRTLNQTHKVELSLFGSGNTHQKISNLIIGLRLYKQKEETLTKNELKLFLNKSTDLYLKIFNGKNKNKYLFYELPFKKKNISLTVFQVDMLGNDFTDPIISVAKLSNGKLTFKTNDPQDPFKFLSIDTELDN